MSKGKTAFSCLIALGISVFSLHAQAKELYTTNNTKFDSTCRTNDFLCSSDILGDAGITKAGEKRKKTTDSQLKLACIKNLRDCKADIYMTNNCDKTGASKVAVIHFDVLGDGIKSIETIDNSYLITGVGFEVTISGGLAAKSFAIRK